MVEGNRNDDLRMRDERNLPQDRATNGTGTAPIPKDEVIDILKQLEGLKRKLQPYVK